MGIRLNIVCDGLPDGKAPGCTGAHGFTVIPGRARRAAVHGAAIDLTLEAERKGWRVFDSGERFLCVACSALYMAQNDAARPYTIPLGSKALFRAELERLAAASGFTAQDILSRRRAPHKVRAELARYAFETLGWRQAAIARELGRDHTSVLAMLRKEGVKKRRAESSPALDRALDVLLKR